MTEVMHWLFSFGLALCQAVVTFLAIRNGATP